MKNKLNLIFRPWRLYLRAIVCLLFLAIVITPVQASPAYYVSYDRSAAVAWASSDNYRNASFHGSDMGRYCTTYVGRALFAGGLNTSQSWYGNQQIVQWMLNNPNSWEDRSLDQLVAGDFVLYSNSPSAPANWAYIDPNGGWSMWNHVALVIAPNRIAAWNAEYYDVDINIYYSLPYHKGVHILDTPPPPPAYVDQGSMTFGTTYERTPNGQQHRWKLTASSGNQPLLFDVRPVSGNLTYQLLLKDASGNVLVNTRSSIDGRGIITWDSVSNGDYYVHIIPDVNSGGTYSITAWANSIPMIRFDWGEQTSYSNVRRWQSPLGATPLNFYVSFNRTAGDLEIDWSLKRRSDGAVLSSGTSVDGRAIAPGINQSGYIDFYITSVTGDGSYRIGIYQGSPLPGVPGIINPAIGSLVPNNFNVVLQPGPGNGVGSPQWNIQIDNDSSFSSPEYDNLYAWSPSSTINVNLPNSGKYWIRARQGDGNGNAGNYTTPIYFYAGTAYSVCYDVTEIPVSECNILQDLYNSTNGANWTNHSGWLQTATPCSWYGIVCESGHVTAIVLGNNNLVGTIPAQLGNLTTLFGLELHNNTLSGPIPPEIGNLTKLVGLNLSINQLSGSIPPQLGNLKNLETLYLGANKLSGSIPSELGNMSQLKQLWINGDLLTGSIPPSLGNLSNLTHLMLYDNQLSGSIPWELGKLSKLQYLFLQVNQLTGSIPNSLGSLSNLTQVFLFSNQLAGSIPPELGNLSNLQYLVLEHNQLTGNIPMTLGSLSQLIDLNINYNQLSGNIPPELGNLTNLTKLQLYSNQLTGSIPSTLGNLSKLTILGLSHNQFSGSIPPELGNLSQLEYLVLGANQLGGSIPPSLGNLSKLIHLMLYENQLSGSIPSELGNLSQLQELRGNNNLLTGSIPSSLGNLPNLVILDFHDNQLSGSIPWQLGNLSKLTWLTLYRNQLSGSIPVSLASMPQLDGLHLGGNQLTGSIPPELGNLPNLEYLILYTNQLTGDIPPELSKLTKLIALSLKENQLTGTIPVWVTNLANLEWLELGGNQLSGNIPSEIGNLKKLTHLTLDHNKLSGEIPTTITNLTNLTDLTLDCRLTSSNASVIAFIESKSPGWQNKICPVLISPQEGAILDNGRDDRLDNIVWDFDWSDIQTASKYHLYVYHSGASYPVIDNPDVTDSAYRYTSIGSYIADVNGYDWNWKVRAYVNGQWGEWSEIRTFSVEPLNTDSPTPPFYSTGAYDGWILESGEKTNKGGAKNSTASTFNVGDDANNRQYLGILHFDTTLPSGAVVSSAKLRIKMKDQAGIRINMFTQFKGLFVDAKAPSFGTPALAVGDFQATGSMNVAQFGNTPVNKWYSATIGSAYINTTGTTQFRVHFKLDDNNDFLANYIMFYSGSAGVNSPQLVVEYYVP